MQAAIDNLRRAAEAELKGKVSNPVTLALGVQDLQASGDDRDQVIAQMAGQLANVSAQVGVLVNETLSRGITFPFVTPQDSSPVPPPNPNTILKRGRGEEVRHESGDIVLFDAFGLKRYLRKNARGPTWTANSEDKDDSLNNVVMELWRSDDTDRLSRFFDEVDRNPMQLPLRGSR
jgi:hypothetical protein